MNLNSIVLCFSAALALAGCATSQAPSPATNTAPAKQARTAAQIPMEELMDDPKANAVFKKHAPDLAVNPQLSMARGMTLAEVAGYSQSGLTEQTVQAIVNDVNKL
jgi:hypothetical protein